LVWQAITKQVNDPGSESEWISVADTPRESLAAFPWSLTGGGASQLQELLERSRETISNYSATIGITSFTLEDDVFIVPRSCARRRSFDPQLVRPMVIGDALRDWH